MLFEQFGSGAASIPWNSKNRSGAGLQKRPPFSRNVRSDMRMESRVPGTQSIQFGLSIGCRIVDAELAALK